MPHLSFQSTGQTLAAIQAAIVSGCHPSTNIRPTRRRPRTPSRRSVSPTRQARFPTGHSLAASTILAHAGKKFLPRMRSCLALVGFLPQACRSGVSNLYWVGLSRQPQPIANYNRSPTSATQQMRGSGAPGGSSRGTARPRRWTSTGQVCALVTVPIRAAAG